MILTDWELVNDNFVGDQVLPARAWGVEDLDTRERLVKILDAGADQFGGEQCTDMLLELVRNGVVAESRIDESAGRPPGQVPARPLRRPLRRRGRRRGRRR
ncbi:hypothetical protein [Streptomyces sp. bgisy027]|uniref:hypothetical protein n=1 Tax=unclassified Streptomyces TaxID=2593676 RepID=UPI003D75F5D2